MKFVAHNEDSQEEEDSILILGADDVKHELSGARGGGCINYSIVLLGRTMTQPRIRLCTYCVVVSLLHMTSWIAPIID